MTRSRYRFLGNDAPCCMTMTINRWRPVFTRPATVAVILDSWRYLQTHHAFRLHGYVILENHLHLIARAPELDRDVRRFKSFTARRLIAVLEDAGARRLLSMLRLFKGEGKLESTYQVWEEGSHPQRIEQEAVMRQKLDYLHYNPVRRGYVDLPEHWRWSSARNYLGQSGLVEVDTGWLGS